MNNYIMYIYIYFLFSFFNISYSDISSWLNEELKTVQNGSEVKGSESKNCVYEKQIPTDERQQQWPCLWRWSFTYVQLFKRLVFSWNNM